jgi:4'-phosphopantetheinyl transferase
VAVQVWLVLLAELAPRAAELEQTLSGDEYARAARFHFARDRTRYVLARGALRGVLGQAVGRPAGELSFAYGPQGKPRLSARAGADEPEFNLSHSDEVALIAVAPAGCDIGIDVERVRPLAAADELPMAIFSAGDAATFWALAPPARDAAFFRAWTRKEALVKATGRGFSTDVAGVEVTFAAGDPPLARRLPPEFGARARWSVRDLGELVPVGYAAAVAAAGSLDGLVAARWPGP